MSKRIFAVVVLNISDEAIADTPERAIGKEEDRLERALTSEYEVETVDVFRVEHYTGRWSARVLRCSAVVTDLCQQLCR